MDIKKIFALIVVLLALFCCISTVSAGFFDFFSEESTQTYTFDGFTLDIPKSAEVTVNNLSETDSDGFSDTYFYIIKMEKKLTLIIMNIQKN